jgi:hypothetical protein
MNKLNLLAMKTAFHDIRHECEESTQKRHIGSDPYKNYTDNNSHLLSMRRRIAFANSEEAEWLRSEYYN